MWSSPGVSTSTLLSAVVFLKTIEFACYDISERERGKSWIDKGRSCKRCPGRQSKWVKQQIASLRTSITSALWSIKTPNQCNFLSQLHTKLNCAFSASAGGYDAVCYFHPLNFPLFWWAVVPLHVHMSFEQDTRRWERLSGMQRVAGLNSAVGKIFFAITLQRHWLFSSLSLLLWSCSTQCLCAGQTQSTDTKLEVHFCLKYHFMALCFIQIALDWNWGTQTMKNSPRTKSELSRIHQCNEISLPY